MIKKYFPFLLFFILFCFGVWYSYSFRFIVDDELYNYGFAKSILDGLIPYVDFNMIIPPLFPYLLSFLLFIFGKYLLIYHLFMIFLIIGITYISYRKFGLVAISIYFILLIYPYIGYNIFSLFLFMIFLFVLDKKNDILEASLVCLMILTKHTLGVLLIPLFLFSRHKKKTLGICILFFLMLCLYLVIFNNFSSFIYYTILGMFDFSSHNSVISSLLWVELLLIVILFIRGFKEKKAIYFYVLGFQVITFPIVDYFHFFVAFVPILYLFLDRYRTSFIIKQFCIEFSVIFLIILSIHFVRSEQYSYMGKYQGDGFMHGRLTYLAMDEMNSMVSKYMEKYPNSHYYLLGNYSYMVKLNLNIPIHRFDIINYGNMGLYGYKGYIKEIENDCIENECLFFINPEELEGAVTNQVSVEILKYIHEHYDSIANSSMFNVYYNKKTIEN